MKKKVLFFYSELATYFLECALLLKSSGFEVHIVHLEVNSEAPFDFRDKYSALNFYQRKHFTLKSLFEFSKQISPDIIFCSGWRDKVFLDVCKIFHSRIPTVLLFDNKWEGNFKQHIASIFSPFKLLNRFSHAWVPGEAQVEFAKKLGFKSDCIFKGFYCADVNLFTDYYNQKLENAQAYSKKKILFIGRYTEFKGLLELWKVFSDLVDEKQLDWELVCLGTGNLHPINHPQIKHVGFVQPSELFSYLEEASFFVLPSRVEPWGVIVHEMAAAGLPLILSDQVGASEAFLIPGENGWSFKSKDYQSLKRVLYSAMSTEPSMLKEMGSRSHMLSRLVNQTQWVNTVASLVRK